MPYELLFKRHGLTFTNCLCRNEIFRSLKIENQPFRIPTHIQGITGASFSAYYFSSNPIYNLFLHHALQWARTVLRVISHITQKLGGGLTKCNMNILLT